jgi:hypothetical protein
MEEVRTSETSVYNETTWRNIRKPLIFTLYTCFKFGLLVQIVYSSHFFLHVLAEGKMWTLQNVPMCEKGQKKWVFWKM